MNEQVIETDVLVVGAGVGGICAALASARTGAKTLLVEKMDEVGGTGVHSPVSLVCRFHATDHRPINLGIHRELFQEIYAYSTNDARPSAIRLTYDEVLLKERYDYLISTQAHLKLITGCGVSEVKLEDRKIKEVTLEDGRVIKAKMVVDGTAEGHLAAMSGCRFEMGRKQDGKVQSATLVFGLGNIDKSQLRIPEFLTREGCHNVWHELNPLYQKMKASGGTKNQRNTVVAFPYPDGERLLFNSTAMLDVDSTDPASIKAAMKEGELQIEELVSCMREHPAFANAEVLFIAPKLGVREGRRIIGDYQLTEEDCLSEARFDDMVAACAYELDIHNPEGGAPRMERIPGSGYYHIPLRCLIAADCDNLLLGSRCISGTHEAHSSYRVMSGVSAIGQGAGTAASLAALYKKDNVREIPAAWVKYVLREQVQFVEGPVEQPEGWEVKENWGE